LGIQEDVDEAKFFLQEELRQGPRKASDVFLGARAVGVSRRALFEAAKELNVVKYKEGFSQSGGWLWELPDKQDSDLLESWFGVEDDVSGDESFGPDPIELLKLSGAGFEKCMASLLQRMGFGVELTGASGDGGIDLVATSKDPIVGGRYLVQCKRFATNRVIGSPIVREFYGAVRADQKAVKGIFITTSSFTPDAQQFAANLPLELIDGHRLAQLLSRFRDIHQR
jgi:hypothetical protein